MGLLWIKLLSLESLTFGNHAARDKNVYGILIVVEQYGMLRHTFLRVGEDTPL